MSAPPENRGRDGKFLPGNNANPGGRPRSLRDVEALAREMSPEALNRLREIYMRGKGSASVRAAELVLAYGIGKPSINVTANVRAVAMDDARFRGAARAALEAAVSEAENAQLPAIPAKEPAA
jgi:hypothetical protein